MIDFVATNRAINNKLIIDDRNLKSPYVGNDHYLVLWKIIFKVGWKQKYIKRQQKKD